jgi:hypothetical protein
MPSVPKLSSDEVALEQGSNKCAPRYPTVRHSQNPQGHNPHHPHSRDCTISLIHGNILVGYSRESYLRVSVGFWEGIKEIGETGEFPIPDSSGHTHLSFMTLCIWILINWISCCLETLLRYRHLLSFVCPALQTPLPRLHQITQSPLLQSAVGELEFDTT